MLREIKAVRQEAGADRRRWFTDAEHDLIIWQRDGLISRFEWCYGKGSDEQAVTWSATHGLQHFRVDDGESCLHQKMSPLFEASATVDFDKVRQDFVRAAQTIDAGITAFVARSVGAAGPLPLRNQKR